jgi:hypothetical protein
MNQSPAINSYGLPFILIERLAVLPLHRDWGCSRSSHVLVNYLLYFDQGATPHH